MGGGSWDDKTYSSSSSTRAAKGIDDFEYTKHATATHTNLDPKRINSKPFGKLESRDSVEHPLSNPVMVVFDVTGSNRERAVDAQKKLPSLMTLLQKYLTDPQVAVGANDDYKVEGIDAVQISDFESDNRIDDHIRSIRLIGNGGGNDGESYDLLLYAAARKTVLDSVEKRGKKGYLFMYADEPFFKQVLKTEVLDVFGDTIEKNIPIAEMIEEARRLWNVFIVWPKGGYRHSREQYVQLFGEESVLDSQHPNLLCELIASTIGLYETTATPASLITDLVTVGVKKHEAVELSAALAHIAGAASLVATGGGKAARL